MDPRQHSVRVVAVTGSNGKTTTKELIAAICAAADFPAPRRRFLKTEGNYNNLIGLPLTLLGLQGDEAVAVLEMGMNRPGEIARLTEIACPDYAVVTNVGPAHLEGVGGTLAGVAAAKGELFAGLSPEAVIAVNIEDEWVRRIAARVPRSEGDLRTRRRRAGRRRRGSRDRWRGVRPPRRRTHRQGPTASHRRAQRDERARGGRHRPCHGTAAGCHRRGLHARRRRRSACRSSGSRTASR